MREGLCLTAASGAVLVVVFGVGAFACSSKAGPADEAISAYLERHGVSLPDATPADDVAVGAPIARRLAVTVERATGLPDADTGPGETDPYVVLEYEGQRHRTSVIEGEREPIWGDTFVLDARPGGVLMVKLMDEDSLASDEQLGTLSETLPDLRIGESRILTLKFRNGESGTLTITMTGMVRP